MLFRSDDILQSINVNKGTTASVNLVFENDSGVLIKKSDSAEITQELTLNENIEAPISKGTVLGKADYFLNNELISSVNLIADNDVSKKSLLTMFDYISSKWLNLLR